MDRATTSILGDYVNVCSGDVKSGPSVTPRRRQMCCCQSPEPSLFMGNAEAPGAELQAGPGGAGPGGATGALTGISCWWFPRGQRSQGSSSEPRSGWVRGFSTVSCRPSRSAASVGQLPGWGGVALVVSRTERIAGARKQMRAADGGPLYGVGLLWVSNEMLT